MKINGFEIEKENVYELPIGAKYSTCPLCSKDRKHSPKEKCLMLDWERGIGTCQHCGEVIQLHTFKKKNTENKKEYKKPEWNNKTELSDSLIKWFESRKISQKTLIKMKVTEGLEYMLQTKKKMNTVQFNYFRDDELVNIKFRDGKKNFKLVKDAELIFYNIDAIRTSDECLCLEGEVDQLSWVDVGYNYAVSTPNGSTLKNVNLEYLDNSIDYFENKKRIYLGLDNDEAGKNVTKELIRRLGADRCYILDFEDCKDSNEYYVKYGAERLRLLKDNAKPVPLENIIVLNDVKSDLHNFYINGSPRGFTTGIITFDEVFSVYLGQFVTVTGVPTHGKSDFVDQMITGYSLNYGWKGAICSVENVPKYLHLDKICRKIYGNRPDKATELESKEWIMVEEWVNDNFFFVDYDNGYDLEVTLAKIKELIKRKGIRYFVLDPYNKIRLKRSINKNIVDYTNDYLNEIDIFCRQNQVLGIIVAHPRKPDVRFAKDFRPTFYDIKGGGEFADMSPHGILVYRNFPKNIVEIEVLKCKFQNLGKNGAVVYFGWNTRNGRYTEIVGDIEEENIQYDFKYNNLLINSVKKEVSLAPNYTFYEPIPF